MEGDGRLRVFHSEDRIGDGSVSPELRLNCNPILHQPFQIHATNLDVTDPSRLVEAAATRYGIRGIDLPYSQLTLCWIQCKPASLPVLVQVKIELPICHTRKFCV